jgi:endonuclease YncB( thermonuclease family)
LLAALLCLSAAAQPQTITGKVVAIADGDTLTVLDASNKQHKIRLDGIDAPESSQDFGSRAKQSLSDLVFGKTVTAISSKKDRYGRTLGKVMLDGKNVNLEQIRRGMAFFYRQYAKELRPEDAVEYEKAENFAKAGKLGLWADPTYENDSHNFLHFSNLNISLGAESKINLLCVVQSSRIGNL